MSENETGEAPVIRRSNEQLRKRNNLAGIALEQGWDGDNLIIALVSYFESHLKCPIIEDENLDECGWNPWAVDRAEQALDLIVDEVERSPILQNSPTELTPSKEPIDPERIPSIPVQVAAKIAREIMARALDGKFESIQGFTKWGEVDLAFEPEMMAASGGETMVWDGQLQPAYERKLRLINERFRDWPEPVAEEVLNILANE